MMDSFGFLLLAFIAYLVLIPLLLSGARRRIRILEGKVEWLERKLRNLLAEHTEPETPPKKIAERPKAPSTPPLPKAPIPATPAGKERHPVATKGEATPKQEATPSREGQQGWLPSGAAEPLGAAPPASDWTERFKDWLLGGNTVARVGVVILFFGVAFLLKYAAERGWFPIELRLAGAALGGIALLAIGWHQRERRKNYGLVLQGGGMGIVYLTVFAAVDTYELLPAGVGLVLMVVLVALASALAVLQDARSLAVLAMVGGFLAPILISREGSHVQLFAYYAVLDAGILAIAWYKAWRELNLVGFAFTFVIGTAWGYHFYQPQFFSTTEPFLVLFFAFYVVVPILFAKRQPPRLQGYVDGTLIFGVPLVAFGLQSALVGDFEYGLAFSALGVGLFYAGLALMLWRRSSQNMRLLTETFLALAVVFGTLAIPLAVDGRWTGAAWALEGSALVWIGLRQNRILARLFGLLVQFGAGISFLAATGLSVVDTPVLNSLYLSALMISLAGLFSGYQLFRHRERLRAEEAFLPGPLLVWSLLWWYGAGASEISRHVAWTNHLTASLALVTFTSAASSLLGRKLAWQQLDQPPLLLLPAMVVIALLQFASSIAPHPLADWGWAAWGSAFVAHYWLLRRHNEEWKGDFPGNAWHSVSLWLIVFLLIWEAWWLVDEAVPEGRTWRYLVLGLVPILVVAGLPRFEERLSWPLQTFRTAYFERGLPPLVVVAVLWVLHATFQPGDPRPLPYLPLLNPLELTQCLILILVFRTVLKDWTWIGTKERWRGLILLGFVVLNGVIARSTHFLGKVQFDLEHLWGSSGYQTTVSITWTLVALAVMVGGTRFRERPVWVVGATLLAAVVAKLFIVDLAGIGTVARIVSFIVVGVLILVTGYLSPLPPRPEERKQT